MNNATSNSLQTTDAHRSLPLAAILCISFVAYAVILIVVLVVRRQLIKKGNKLSCDRCFCQCEKLNCNCDLANAFVNPCADCWKRFEEINCCSKSGSKQWSKCPEQCCNYNWSCPISSCQEPLLECPSCKSNLFSCQLPDCSVIDCCCFEIRMKNGRNSAPNLTV